MAEPTTLTNDAGNPIPDNRHSHTVGPNGPVLLQDAYLLEKLAVFNRERVPERVVHATGTGCYGVFEVTHPNVAQWTKMAMFANAGKKTESFVRFSTVAGSKGSPDLARDPRGFAMKFYTEDGNWDLVGNNTPIFFVRDGIKFTDFIHSQKYDPYTNRREPNNIWDFFAGSPEATHMFTWLYGDRGVPASYRTMNGYGSHTFMWINQAHEKFWVKFHMISQQGVHCLTQADAEAKAGADAEYLQHEFYDHIEARKFPQWIMKVQVMPFAAAADYRFNPFDVTKIWPHGDFPLTDIGRLTLNQLPGNYFAHTEQSAFNPSSMPPGVAASPDRMLQARLFAYGDAHRYRLGTNHNALPVNATKGCPGGVHSYARDGFMRFDDNAGGSANYEPNTRGGPVAQTGAYDAGYDVRGSTGPQPHGKHKDDDDFRQAGRLFELMGPEAQDRLVQNMVGQLAKVTLPKVVERSVEHLRNAHPDYGKKIEAALGKARAAQDKTKT